MQKRVTKSLKILGSPIFMLVLAWMSIQVGISSPASAIYTNTQLNDKLQYGLDTAVALDFSSKRVSDGGVISDAASNNYDARVSRPCYEVMARYPLTVDDPREKYTVRSGSDLFSNENTPSTVYPHSATTGISIEGVSASYRPDNWVSAAGLPNIYANDISVPYGASTVNLQINSMSFTCRPFAAHGALARPSCNMTGQDWLNAAGWIRNTSSAVDSRVHVNAAWNAKMDAGTSNCFANEKIWQKIYPTSLTVTSGGGSVTTGAINNEITTLRDDSSRFWFSPEIAFTYDAGSAITSTRTVEVTMTYRQQNQYVVNRSGLGGNYLMAVCFDNTGVAGNKIQQYSSSPVVTFPINNNNPKIPWGTSATPADQLCREQTARFRFEITVRGPTWRTSGNTTVNPAEVSIGQTANWNHIITNAGSSQSSTDPLTYQVNQRVDGGASTTAGLPSGTTPRIARGSSFPTSSAFTATAADVGKRICRYITWNYLDSTRSSQGVSNEACITVVAKPFVQVWGQDVRVGSSVTNLASGNKNSVVTGSAAGSNGSWGEYGVFAPGCVNNFASGHGLNGTSPTGWNKLTFANTGTGLCTGGGVFTSPPSSLGITPASAVDTYFTADKGYLVRSDTSTDTLPSINGAIIVRPTGGVFTINQNIVYPNNVSPSSMSQVIIIANRINIRSNVTRVDAWLVARGIVDTCSDVDPTADLRLNNCNQQLKINGPIIARELRLKRTTPPDTTDPDKPAEILNLRADAYVWTYKESQKTGSYRTTYVRELSPRF